MNANICENKNIQRKCPEGFLPDYVSMYGYRLFGAKYIHLNTVSG
jgi:hypothetical protein